MQECNPCSHPLAMLCMLPSSLVSSLLTSRQEECFLCWVVYGQRNESDDLQLRLFFSIVSSSPIAPPLSHLSCWHAHTHTTTCTHTTQTYTNTHTNMHTHVHTHIHAHICAHKHTCTHTNTCIHTQTCTHRQTHTSQMYILMSVSQTSSTISVFLKSFFFFL